jgi:hypothetical protein
MGLWAPKHYMKQFHPKYTSQDQLDAQAKAAGFDNWASYFKDRNDTSRNMDCPTTAPWKYTSPVTAPAAVQERNPYYFAVDTEGNQLPHIDKITWTLAENEGLVKSAEGIRQRTDGRGDLLLSVTTVGRPSSTGLASPKWWPSTGSRTLASRSMFLRSSEA